MQTQIKNYDIETIQYCADKIRNMSSARSNSRFALELERLARTEELKQETEIHKRPDIDTNNLDNSSDYQSLGYRWIFLAFFALLLAIGIFGGNS